MAIKSAFYFSFDSENDVKHPVFTLWVQSQDFNMEIIYHNLDELPIQFYKDLLNGDMVSTSNYGKDYNDQCDIIGNGDGTVTFSIRTYGQLGLWGKYNVTTSLEQVRKDFEEYIREKDM